MKRNANINIKKQIKVIARTTNKKVSIRVPKQIIGNVYLDFEGKVLKQWELELKGDTLKVIKVK